MRNYIDDWVHAHQLHTAAFSALHINACASRPTNKLKLKSWLRESEWERNGPNHATLSDVIAFLRSLRLLLANVQFHIFQQFFFIFPFILFAHFFGETTDEFDQYFSVELFNGSPPPPWHGHCHSSDSYLLILLQAVDSIQFCVGCVCVFVRTWRRVVEWKCGELWAPDRHNLPYLHILYTYGRFIRSPLSVWNLCGRAPLAEQTWKAKKKQKKR